jgi:hypothetical protein
LTSANGSLYVGGDFTNIGDQFHPYFAQFKPLTPFTAPAPPTSLGLTAVQADRVTLKWNDASDNDEGFKIWADPGLTTPTTQRTIADASVTSWVLDGLIPNTPYTFQVASTNDIGDSAKTDLCTTWTLIQPLGGLDFTANTGTSLSVAPTATLSNLTSGSSGLYLANTTAGTSSGWRQSAAWTCTGLTPNTQYTFSGKARNGAGVETAPITNSCVTLAAAPVIGGNVTCDRAPGQTYSYGTAFPFTNPAGFGAGTHGGSALMVTRFRYAWDNTPTHAFGVSEEYEWYEGFLTLNPTATGPWYLHLQSVNMAGVAGPTLDYGPFNYDRSAGRFTGLSDTPTTSSWTTDYLVNAIAQTSSTIYLGGTFSHVGQPVGFGVPLSAASGQPAGRFPKVNGPVLASVPDGVGGWYIGGQFTQVGELVRTNIAHILAGGDVDAQWNPYANGAVNALADRLG